MHALDVISIGRSSVDLYGTQIGGRLEDMVSFNKYIGGSPTNIAVGCARLGLKSALITRVGDEPMGRFIREQLQADGVDVTGVITDPDRLSALVLLGIRDQEQFPLIFYRENCADMALCENDIDAHFIASAACITATGTHLSHPDTEAAVLKAIHLAREYGSRTALDIDYRPTLWGLSGHDDGENRYIESERVTEKLQITLHLFDLIVGTEEEFHIAGGSNNTIQALKKVRQFTAATLVCKLGPMGAVAFVGDIPETLQEGLSGSGFEIEVFNVLGAGDGFMSGLLRGWIKGEDWTIALTYANACGALAVSRHGCSPSYPSWLELEYFLSKGVQNRALRHDKALEQIHWSSNRKGQWADLRVFAFDHRQQMTEIADKAGVSHDRIAKFKQLCLKTATEVAGEQKGYGILCDSLLGQDTLYNATGSGLWIARPVEVPGSRPLVLEIEPDYGSALAQWPISQVVKVLCFYHSDDEEKMKIEQETTLLRLAAATRANGLEFLLEIIPSKVGILTEDTVATIIQRIYDIGIYPDWWKLEPLKTMQAWKNVCDCVERNDPHTRGIVILGLDAPQQELEESFACAAGFPLVKGFAVGRTIFSGAAKKWFSNEITDLQAIDDMRKKYQNLCNLWDKARGASGVEVV